MAPSKVAASVTFRAIGPAVSWLWEMGITPARLIRPTVGLMPTSEQQEEGETIDPSVSEPTATAQRLAATDAAEPELEPDGVRSSTYGFRHCPPRPLHPDDECEDRKLAHSERFVLPRMTAPAARSLSVKNASLGTDIPTIASDPAVDCCLSSTAMLSLRSTGIPCSGPRGPLAFRSASSASAIASASGLVSITARSIGPFVFTASIRARYASASARAVYSPFVMPDWSPAMVTSSRSMTEVGSGEWGVGASARTGRPKVADILAAAVTPMNDRRSRFLSDIMDSRFGGGGKMTSGGE